MEIIVEIVGSRYLEYLVEFRLSRNAMSSHKELIRHPVARDFYPGDIKSQIYQFIADFIVPENLSPNLIGAVVPHAGWRYSGQTAARTLYCLSKKSKPDVCVMFGADHSGLYQHSMLAAGEWETPLGNLSIAEEACKRILEALPQFLVEDNNAHNREHSIEVVMPLVRYFFPTIRIVPIIMRPEKSSIELGEQIGELFIKMNLTTIYIASTDLTHYGDVFGFTPAGLGKPGIAWMRSNDLRMINYMESCHGVNVLTEARQSLNACGAGAIAALLGTMETYKIDRGQLIEYSTSHSDTSEVGFKYGVGYAGIVY